MRNRVIIELELLTPLKYRESVHISNTGWGVVLEIVEPYKAYGTIKNTKTPPNSGGIGRKATLEDIQEGEECILIESSELGNFISQAEFKGLSKFEHYNRCTFIYKVKSTNKEALDVLYGDPGRRKMKYYLKRTDIDDETGDVFADMFNSL
jgi:hypothetical protein